MSAFDDICEAARVGDRQRLEYLYTEHKTLEVRKGLITPMEQLASEGNVSAVELFFTLSCKKGFYFEFDMEGAFRGAGFKGEACFDALLRLIKKKLGYQFKYNESRIYMGSIEGAARAGNFDVVERLQPLLQPDPFDDFRTSGAAQGGHFSYLDQHPGSLKEKLEGAARGGHADFVRELIQQIPIESSRASASSRTDMLERTLCAAAEAGHDDIVMYLIQEGASENAAVAHAAKGGHYNLVHMLIRDGASKDHAVVGAVVGGHFAFTCELVQQYDVSEDLAITSASAHMGPYFETELKKVFTRKPQVTATASHSASSLFSRRRRQDDSVADYGTTADAPIEMTETRNTAATLRQFAVSGARAALGVLTNNPAFALGSMNQNPDDNTDPDESSSLLGAGRSENPGINNN